MRFYTLLFTIFLSFSLSFANEKEDQIKVAYVYNFLKNISWEKESSFSSYRVLIVSNNDTLDNMFKMLSSRKQLKDKNIEVILYSDKKEKNIQAIFIDSSEIEAYEKLYYEYENSNTLLISDNYIDKKQVMINLVEKDERISFEINKANILNRSLNISPDIILLGGTEIDVAKLYKSSQDDLKEQKEIVETLSKNIEDKNAELKDKLKAIDEQKAIISEQTKNIQTQTAQIELQKKELKEIYSDIENQKEKLYIAQKETSEKEENINRLIYLQKEQEKSFEESKKNLDILLKTIDEQNSNIILKEEAIKNQKNIIILFSILFVIILILIFNSIRQNKKLKKSNILIDEMLSQTKELHKKLTDSVEYSGMIQSALISNPVVLKPYFKESYAVWQPKDVVGGDIYIFEEINEDECLIFVIDCTGHSVPGALVTVLVKSIERNIVSHILNGEDKEVSPANLLAVFNRSIKNLLKQNDKNSLSNAGFDGSILYYNKKTAQIKFASANNIVLLLRDGEIREYKGDRHSVGYKTSEANFVFKEYSLEAKKSDIFFLSTDGLYDQNGGTKDLPLGRKKIKNILLKNKDEPLNDIKEIILYELGAYQGKNERNDDIAFVSFKI